MRRVKMSRKLIFLVVEGRELDANFYGSLIESLPEVGPAGYEVVVIDQISGLRHQSGKNGVLELHDRCRRQGALRQKNKSGSRSIVFFVDRDLDHATGRMRRSPHIIYTCHYNVESEIFIHGDDAVAVARALSLAPAEGRQYAKHLGNWPRELSNTWSDWLELCVIDAGLRTGTGASPARHSAINDEPYGAVSLAKQRNALAAIRARASAGSRREGQLRSRYRNIARQHGSETLLNGKHFPQYFEFRAKEYFRGQPVATSGCGAKVVHCYLAAIDYTAPWAEPYRRALRTHLA